MIAGIHYWWPKMTGRMYNETAAVIAWAMVFIGFNVTFFPQFLMGAHGMPRRYYNYPPEFELGHFVSSMGSYLMAVGFVVIAWYLIASLINGKRAPANPWGGATLEWRCSSPPPHDNFATPPRAGDPYDFDDLKYDPNQKGWVPTGPAGSDRS
jgi:cytochrome c oxidase subunit 1